MTQYIFRFTFYLNQKTKTKNESVYISRYIILLILLLYRDEHASGKYMIYFVLPRSIHNTLFIYKQYISIHVYT